MTAFEQDFVFQAFLATCAIAPACGFVGYFIVFRNQVFASDAMSHAAFTGSLVALGVGFQISVGLFGLTIAFAVLLAILGTRVRLGASEVAIGNAFAWMLGIGVLFLSIYARNRSAGADVSPTAVLFGSVFGIGLTRAWVAVAVSAVVMVVVAMFARRSMFASIDPDVASAQGVSLRGVDLTLLVATAIMVAEATQIVGALLVLGLIATPALAARNLTNRPFVAMWLSGLVALFAGAFGLMSSVFVPVLPASFCIPTLAFMCYLGSLPWQQRARHRSDD